MGTQADIGLIGLGVMGQNLVLNMCDHGYTVAVFNRTAQKTTEFITSPEAQGKALIPCYSIEELLAVIRPPRPVMLMVKAGEPVDANIEVLLPLLDKGDILIDGGNSFFKHTIRRHQQLRESGIHFVGMGVSGGEEGARHGPSLMPGGSLEAYQRVEKIFLSIAARPENGTTPCCAYIGDDGAGHYVKMVHNGIEYADMQLIAESCFLLRQILRLDYSQMREIFLEWNEGELRSYLIEITADILGRNDPLTGNPMVEMILDRAGQKGTGQWTATSALELGISAPTIAEAVFARSLSAQKETRLQAEKILAPALEVDDLRAELDVHQVDFVTEVCDALYASKIVVYAQGFALLAAAAREYGWKLDLAEISLLWRGGCIIRAQFLERIAEAYRRDQELPNLLFDPYFKLAIARMQIGWRRVASLCARSGCSAPAFTSALAYYDALRTGTLWTNLTQAQRDYFGAHTYERIDRPRGEFFHTDWQS